MIVPEFSSIEEHVAFMEEVYGKKSKDPKDKKGNDDSETSDDKPPFPNS